MSNSTIILSIITEVKSTNTYMDLYHYMQWNKLNVIEEVKSQFINISMCINPVTLLSLKH